jgi:Tol biopolymer transport system component
MLTQMTRRLHRFCFRRHGLAYAAVLVSAVLYAGVARADTPAASPLRETLKAQPFKIAYESYHDGHSDVFVMNADGSDKVNLTHSAQNEGAQAHYPQVSPDGTRICYTIDTGEGRDAVRSLWVMDVDGKNAKKIADHAREPFWAPDGKVIGYLPQEYPKFDVIDYYTKGMVYYHVDTGESEPHPNSANLRHLYHPRFAPGGQWIVSTVHGGMGFSHAILAIEAHGDKIVNLNIPGCRPTVSPDGSHIAWGSGDHDLTTAPIDFTGDAPKVAKPDLRITDSRNKIYHIAWAPDGKFVAFSRGPDGDGDLSKTGTFRAACEIIGVYATDWNLYAVSTEHGSVIDLDKASEADVTQLTSDGASNKEPAWFRPAK